MLSSYEQKICDEINNSKNEMISLLKELISVPSNNPPGENYSACTDIIYKYLKKNNAKIEIVQAPLKKSRDSNLSTEILNKPNIYAEIRGCVEGPHIHFNGHYDVVPATGNWRSNPYKPFIKNSRIYGRGSADMKGGISAMLLAAKILASQKIPFRGTLSLSFVQDEENDGETGSKYLINNKNLKADYCIVGEPSGADSLYLGHYGTLWLEIMTIGKSAHGSAPDEGINAFEKMVDFINEIRASSNCFVQNKNELNNKKGTITIGGIITSGVAVNIVPDKCKMTIDRRLAPGENIKVVLKYFSGIIKSLSDRDPDFKAELKVLSRFNSCSIAEDSYFAQVVKNAIHDITGEQPEARFMKASCDMRYFHQKGIPTLIYGPGDISQAHQTDEYIDIESMLIAAKVYALTALRLLHFHDSKLNE